MERVDALASHSELSGGLTRVYVSQAAGQPRASRSASASPPARVRAFARLRDHLPCQVRGIADKLPPNSTLPAHPWAQERCGRRVCAKGAGLICLSFFRNQPDRADLSRHARGIAAQPRQHGGTRVRKRPRARGPRLAFILGGQPDRPLRLRMAAGPLECPKCHGPMRIIALIDDPPVVRRILDHQVAFRCMPKSRSTSEPVIIAALVVSQ